MIVVVVVVVVAAAAVVVVVVVITVDCNANSVLRSDSVLLHANEMHVEISASSWCF